MEGKLEILHTTPVTITPLKELATEKMLHLEMLNFVSVSMFSFGIYLLK